MNGQGQDMNRAGAWRPRPLAVPSTVSRRAATRLSRGIGRFLRKMWL